MFTPIRDHLHERTDAMQRLADQAKQTKIDAEQPTTSWATMTDVAHRHVLPTLGRWQSQLKTRPRDVDKQPLHDIRQQLMALSRDRLIEEMEQTLIKLEASYRLLQMRRGTRGFLRWTRHQLALGLQWIGRQLDLAAHRAWYALKQRLFG